VESQRPMNPQALAITLGIKLTEILNFILGF